MPPTNSSPPMLPDDAFQRVTNVVCTIISIPSLLLYVLTIGVIIRRQQLRSKAGYQILVAQNTVEALILFIKLCLITQYTSDVSAHPSSFGCFVGNAVDTLWFVSVFAQLMVAGNRLVAVVHFAKYKLWFTPKATALYISVFVVGAALYRNAFTIAGVSSCLLLNGDFVFISGDEELLSWYFDVDKVVTPGIILTLILAYSVIVHRVRKSMKVRKTAAAPLNVPPASSVETATSRVVSTVHGAAWSGASSHQDAGDGAPSAGDGTGAVSIMTSAGVSGGNSNSKNVLHMGKDEVKLTLYFLLVTVMFLVSWLTWTVGYIVGLRHMGEILDILITINFSVNCPTTR